MTLTLFETPVDEVIVLRAGASYRATKTHSKAGTKDYSAGATFEWRAAPVTSIHDIYNLQKQLAAEPRELVIRGEPINRKKIRVYRLLHRDIVYERAPDWRFADPGRRWIMFDIDKMNMTWSPSQVDEVIAEARRRLPPEFANVTCVYHLSSSAGFKAWDTASVHLWFWLDRPVACQSVREWADGKRNVDASIFNAVQAHYTADPVILDSLEDPFASRRVGLSVGTAEVAKAPAEWLDYPGWLAEAERKAQAYEDANPPPQHDETNPEAVKRYVLGALAKAVEHIRDQANGVGPRHPTAVKEAVGIGGYVGAGYIDRRTVEISLIQAIQAVVPDYRHEDEARTVRQMVEVGISRPRFLRKAWAIPWAKINSEGKPYSCTENTEVMLAHYGATARYNMMLHLDELHIRGYDGTADREQNAALAQMREWARRHGLNDAQQLTDHLTLMIANDKYHPVAEWIRSAPWDGISRIDALFSSLRLRDPTQGPLLLRGFYAWAVTAARAALLPHGAKQGVASQLVFVLQGHGGRHKTRWILSLALHGSDWVREGVTLDPNSRDSVQQTTGSWIIELGELDATFKKADLSALKAFLTNRKDVYRGAFDRKPESLARRTVFAASVNPQHFLYDDNGNRRYVVVGIDECNPAHGIDMQQFWAEMALAPYEDCFLSKEDEKTIVEMNYQLYEVRNPIVDQVAFWWTPTHAEEWHTLSEILRTVDIRKTWTNVEQQVAARALSSALGARTRVLSGYRLYAVTRTKDEKGKVVVEDLFGNGGKQ